ncbi:MAG: hypothetical protein JJ974_02485 [Phycisphaerales bacterium]|nr:hypothetical protein [Phycisphaerales bacterium]
MDQSTLPTTDSSAAITEGQAPTPSLSAGDLAELMSSFNEVTAKLEKTHTQLRNEVVRLNTELTQANEALQRSKRLAALGEMAAGISHEIRNPLGSIRLYTRMLHEDLAEMPEQCSIVDKIGRAVTGLDQIVGDVLAFSRELRVRQDTIDSSMLLSDAQDACLAELQGIKVEIEIDQDCNELLGDASLLHQALINIIRNGAQATKDNAGGVMTLGVSRSEDGGRVLFVRDSGGGIESSVIERMFNPFFTTRAAGTGLGLSIVHRIMDAHGGSVRVENTNDESDWTHGAIVSLHLPKQLVSTPSEEGQPQIVVRAGRMSESSPHAAEPSAQGETS